MLCIEINACCQIHNRHMNAPCGKNVQLLKLNLVVYKVTKCIERISVRAVGIRRTRSITARGKLATHFHLRPRLKMSVVVMHFFQAPSRHAREQLYIFIKL